MELLRSRHIQTYEVLQVYIAYVRAVAADYVYLFDVLSIFFEEFCSLERCFAVSASSLATEQTGQSTAMAKHSRIDGCNTLSV